MSRVEKRNFLTTTRGIFLTAMVCCLLWGSAFPCVKIGYELFRMDTSHIPTLLLYAGLRFTIAGVLGIVFGSLIRKKALFPARQAWGNVLMMAMIQTVIQYIFYYIGFAHTTGVKGSIICGSNSFISILIASFIFRQEKFTSRKALGCVLGFAGVILINLNGSGLGGGFAWNGEAFLVCSTTAYSLSSVLMRIYGQEEDPITISGYQFVLGGVILSAIGFGLGGRLTFYSASCVLMLVYLGFVSAGAFTLWSILLKYNPVSRVSIYSVMTPIFGVTLSTLLLSENSQVSAVQCMGALALVSLGIWTINRPAKVK